MILTLALRSLLARPVRSAVLAGGFGLGVSVMATLLGVGEVVLDQAREPALVGGGDVIVAGAGGRVSSARWLLWSLTHSPALKQRVVAAAPTSRATLYVADTPDVAVRARGTIPSLERALDDPETRSIPNWTDTAADAEWTQPDPDDILRAMDRFHPVPSVPSRDRSWAEWLYFNGRTDTAQFYLTFLTGPTLDSGRRQMGVRLQLNRGGQTTAYSTAEEMDEKTLLDTAPDLTIGGTQVRLVNGQYRVRLDLPAEADSNSAPQRGGSRARVTGEIVLATSPARSFPPFSIRGAGGWVSGYVIPVMSGALDGTMTVGGERVVFAGGTGYHDHNWGFWEGVSWRWGQVQNEELSFVYGRVYPPSDAADPSRLPGFLMVLGPDGPIGYATDVSIEERDLPDHSRPGRIVVRGRNDSLDLTMDLTIEDAIVTRMGPRLFGSGLDFLQLRAAYRVAGHVGEKTVNFTARGAAETFRGR